MSNGLFGGIFSESANSGDKTQRLGMGNEPGPGISPQDTLPPPLYHKAVEVKNYLSLLHMYIKVRKGAKISSRYNQVPHLTQDTNEKVTNSQFDTTYESKESALSQQVTTITYEGHPINRENFLIMQEFVPLEHGKCNH